MTKSLKLSLREVRLVVRYNTWHFFIKLLALCITLSPFKASLIGFAARVRATFYFIFKYKKHKKITEIRKFAQHCGSNLPKWLFVYKFLVQRETDNLWCLLFHEVPNQLQKYISITNKELLENALTSKKGAVLLGMHYGPAFTRFLLKRENIHIKTLILSNHFKNLEKYQSKIIKPLILKKDKFSEDNENYIEAVKYERKLITSLKEGIPVMIYADFIGPYKKGITENFLGLPMEISSFPFKLALKYNVPVFLCSYKKALKGVYDLSFVKIEDFNSPEEGVHKYLGLLERKILEYPFMWEYVPDFLSWFSIPQSK